MVADCTTTAPSADCFVHRVTALPLVSSAVKTVVSSYETTKHYNPLLESTFGYLEGSVQYATEKAKPVYDGYLHDSVITASKVACKGLDRLEETYPAMKMTPEQLKEISQEYYEKSYVKQGVDKVVATKDFGLQKVDETRAQYHRVLSYLFNYGTNVLNGSLDYCDDLIEKYVAEGGSINEADKNKSYVQRVQTMGGKMATGLTAKSARQVANAKVAVQKAIADFKGAMALVEYAKSTRDWAGQSTSHLMTNVAALKETLEKQAKQYNIQPEVLLLRWVKLSAGMLSAASDQMLKRTVLYLPETAKNTLEAASAYCHYLDQSFSEANSLSDVKDELLSEVKEKMGMAEHGFLQVLERFSDYPPLNWMGFNSPNTTENDESKTASNCCENSTAH